MAKLTEQDFKKELTSGELRSLYLIYGEEKYLVRAYTEKLIKKAVGKKSSDFDTAVLNSDSDIAEIYSAVEALPVFSDRKVVIVKDYDINALSEDDYRNMEKMVSDIPDCTVLIFTMPTLKSDDKKKASKLTKFASFSEKYGTVLELNPLGDIALEKLIISWAEKNGCKLTSINASKIIASVGTDMNLLRNEIDKLSAYANGNEITLEIIDLLCPKNSEARIYALADSISTNDFNSTYRQLEILLDKNEKPEIILSVLSSAFVDMYRMRAASEAGKTNSQVAADFKYGKREFLLKNARNNVKKYSTETLREILEVILDADIRLKSTSADSGIILETMIAKLLITVREGMKV